MTRVASEPAGALAAIDMPDEELVQHLASLAARRCQSCDLGILNPEFRDFQLDTAVGLEFVPVPEIIEVGERACEDTEEALLDLDGAIREDDLPHPETRVDEFEECVDICAHRVSAYLFHDLVEVGRDILIVRSAATTPGTEAAMEDVCDTAHRHRGHDLLTEPALLPLDATLQGEGLIKAQLRDHVDGLEVRLRIPQKHVHGDLRTGQVQNLEAIPLPVVRRVEMNRTADVDVGTRVLGDDRSGSTHALETVDNVDFIEKDVISILLVGTPCPVSTHAEFNVRHCRHQVGLLELGHLVAVQDLSLVFVDLETVDGRGIDHPAKDKRLGLTWRHPECIKGGSDQFYVHGSVS